VTKDELKNVEDNHRLMKKAMRFFNKQLKAIPECPEALGRWGGVKKDMNRIKRQLRKQVPDMPVKVAELIAFDALEEAIDHKPDQLCPDFKETVEDWWESVPLHVAPIAHEIMNVGFDMSNGFTEKEARQLHQKWLNEDEEHRMFNGYFYAPDGTVVNMEVQILAEA